MAGYREHSFDPYAYEQPGRPMRPFNWVQWTGVAFEVIGITLYLAFIAGRLGWVAPIIGSGFGFVAAIIGVVLINSRREPSTEAGSEQLAKNRRVLLITVPIVCVILGFAAVIDLWRTGP